MCIKLAKANESRWAEKLTSGMPTSTSTYDIGMYGQVLALFSAKATSLKMRAPNKDTAITDTMYKGFLANNLTPEEVQQKTNKAWADGYRGWKAGK